MDIKVRKANSANVRRTMPHVDKKREAKYGKPKHRGQQYA